MVLRVINYLILLFITYIIYIFSYTFMNYWIHFRLIKRDMLTNMTLTRYYAELDQLKAELDKVSK